MSGVTMTLGDFQNATFPGLSNRWVQIGKGRHPSVLSDFYNVEGSSQAVEVHTIYNGMDLMTPISEGGTAPPDSFEQKATKYYDHQEYRQSFNVTRKLLDDGKAFPVMEKGSMMLGESYVESQNVTGMSAINNAFSSELAADGIAIVSASSHKSMAGTTGNRLSTNAAISEAALEQINIEIKKFKDDRGLKCDLKPVQVIGPPDIEAEMCRLITNPNRPGTADRDINYINNTGVFPGGYKSNIYLSDGSTSAWFVLTNDKDDGMMFFNRVGLEIKSTVDDETDNMIVRSYGRWSYGCTKWSCLFASQGV